MSSSGSSNPTNIDSLFQQFLTGLGSDAKGIVKGIIGQLGASWTSNPSPENVTTSSMLAEAQLILSGPTLEKDGIARAGNLLTQVSNLL